MKKTTLFHPVVQVIIAILVALLLAGCSGGDTEVENGALRLIFDGEDCIYEGPTTVKSGPVTLDFLNESDGLATLVLAKIIDGKSIQDMEDYVGEEPSTKIAPPWTEMITLENVEPGEKLIQEEIVESGIYTAGCGRIEPFGAWFGTGLTVED